jgi:hypothetical protein
MVDAEVMTTAAVAALHFEVVFLAPGADADDAGAASLSVRLAHRQSH